MNEVEPRLRVISLGAGVQSTVMSLMGAEGAFGPVPDAAIFADTGWEPPYVYEHLDWLTAQLPYPVYRTGLSPTLLERLTTLTSHSGHKGYLDIPVYLKGHTLSDNGIGASHCTTQYKIKPIQRKLRELLGVPKGHKVKGVVEQWMGISTNEAIRMKDSRDYWIVKRHPLIEVGMSRVDCSEWWNARYDWPLRRSSCIGCPYQSASRWLETKTLFPEDFAVAAKIDNSLRSSGLRYARESYLHKSRRPLAEAVALTEAQGRLDLDPDGFGNECEGHCGV